MSESQLSMSEINHSTIDISVPKLFTGKKSSTRLQTLAYRKGKKPLKVKIELFIQMELTLIKIVL